MTTVKISVFVDFDGTIAVDDTTDRILERFADPAWRDVESDWEAGRIGSRECMARQIEFIRARPEEIDAFARNAAFDPAFPQFVTFCRTNGIEVTVVSDGLDRVARQVLTRAGVEVDLISNHLESLGGDRWRLAFPHARSDCRSSAGTCKCSTVTAKPNELRILIGDGHSDFCAAGVADLVLAKDSLAEHCATAGISYRPFTDFVAAIGLVGDWIKAYKLSERAAGTPEAPVYASPA